MDFEKPPFIFFLFLLQFNALFSNAQINCPSTLTLGISFPGVNAEEAALTKEKLTKLGVNKIRFDENWRVREGQFGVYEWDIVDTRIDWLIENNFEIFLTIPSYGPDWRCKSITSDPSCVFINNVDFKLFCDTLLKRNAGKIKKIQFGNEWQTNYWYPGTAQEFIDANNILYDCVKYWSPTTQVVLGGFSTSSLRYLTACGGGVTSFVNDLGVTVDGATLSSDCASPEITTKKLFIESVLKQAKYDCLDLHFYDDVDQWDEYYAYFKTYYTTELGLPSKTILVSEFGGPNQNYQDTSDAAQAIAMGQYINKLENMGITEAYAFKLIELTNGTVHQKSGLLRNYPPYPEKQAFQVFSDYSNCVTSIASKETPPSILIYPNPANQNTVFQNTNRQILTLTVYDALGRTIRSTVFSGDIFYWHTLNLNKGIYFVKIQDESGAIASSKVVVE